MAIWIYMFLRGVGVVSRGVLICSIAPWIMFFWKLFRSYPREHELCVYNKNNPIHELQ
jgi:hypothetical protein